MPRGPAQYDPKSTCNIGSVKRLNEVEILLVFYVGLYLG